MLVINLQIVQFSSFILKTWINLPNKLKKMKYDGMMKYDEIIITFIIINVKTEKKLFT